MDQINRVLFVTKRDGTKQDFNPKKLELLLYKLCFNLAKKYLSVEKVIEHIRSGLYDGVNTKEIITLLAETVAQMTSHHPDYAILAGRLAIVDLHKNTKEKFTDVISDLYNIKDEDTGAHEPIISKKHYTFAIANADRLNEAIAQERDLEYSYFAYKTLERSYLLKLNGKIAERPQHLLMRVAIGIHADDIDAAIETYDLMSKKYFTHASPTMFSAATCRAQLSSCFLLSVTEDSVKGICGETLSRTTEITKYGGGIGLNFHCVRAKGTKIKGTSGISKGIVPFLRLYNCAALAIDQSGNKRPGSMAIYLEPWHADIKDFLNLKKNTGVENERARDLFYALWIPDLFMKRVEADDVWSLMCPHECPGLFDCWGNEFDELYQKYEKEKRYKEQVKARDIWYKIYESQVETGTPYMLYKDACNRKSNQQNLGTIRCSNLCTEIMEYCDRDEIAVCNLASIALNKFVVDENTYDFNMLKHMAKVLTINLNKIIDINYYPEPEAERSNRRHRPIGIGVQGLADVFMLMKCGYESEKAQKLNMEIFETIYYGALEASCELAEKYGTYETYAGSPVSKGILQFDMWEVTPTALWNWNSLKEKISKNGVRNSLLIAPMPTASTAQILGNNESFEPYTTNIYTRRVLSGEFQVVNPHLVNELIKLNLWNEDMRNQLVANYGSVQNITSIPEAIRETYKTVWEISVKTTIKMAADRGAFIDQSQSFNIHVAQPTYMKMSSIHFYAWKMGLKTGMYYLRTKPAANAIQFTVDKDRLKTAQLVCSRENKDDCLMCGA